ncbi:unnamed protein product [Paramecium sonneborni]|uniref:Uncharacterized protein n=1 Tax=Paramecium sonneborni TaxID=65129 RepID=A0A8S1RTD3_9CILI|nr:unnamed protein product [Paramecium sonneborni]
MEDFEVQDYSTGLSRFYSIEGAEILEIRDVIKVINKDMKELSDELYFNMDNTFEVIYVNNLNYSCITIGIEKKSFKNTFALLIKKVY